MFNLFQQFNNINANQKQTQKQTLNVQSNLLKLFAVEFGQNHILESVVTSEDVDLDTQKKYQQVQLIMEDINKILESKCIFMKKYINCLFSPLYKLNEDSSTTGVAKEELMPLSLPDFENPIDVYYFNTTSDFTKTSLTTDGENIYLLSKNFEIITFSLVDGIFIKGTCQKSINPQIDESAMRSFVRYRNDFYVNNKIVHNTNKTNSENVSNKKKNPFNDKSKSPIFTTDGTVLVRIIQERADKLSITVYSIENDRNKKIKLKNVNITNDTFIETNGNCVIFANLKNEKLEVVIYSLLTGKKKFTSTIQCNLNLIALTFDSINCCHWAVVESGGKYSLQRFKARSGIPAILLPGPWTKIQDDCGLYIGLIDENAKKIDKGMLTNLKDVTKRISFVSSIKKNAEHFDKIENFSKEEQIIFFLAVLEELLKKEDAKKHFLEYLPSLLSGFDLDEFRIKYFLRRLMIKTKARYMVGMFDNFGDSYNDIMITFDLIIQQSMLYYAYIETEKMPSALIAKEIPECCHLFANYIGVHLKEIAKKEMSNDVFQRILVNTLCCSQYLSNVMNVALIIIDNCKNLLSLPGKYEEHYNLLILTSYVYAKSISVAIHGGRYSNFEEQYNWIIQPNVSSTNIEIAGSISYKEHAKTMQNVIYKKWKPLINKNVPLQFLNIDIEILTAIRQVFDVTEEDITSCNLSGNLQQCLDIMLQIRNLARQKNSAANERNEFNEFFTSIVHRSQFLRSCKTSFSRSDSKKTKILEFFKSSEPINLFMTMINSQKSRVDFAQKGLEFLYDVTESSIKSEIFSQVAKIIFYEISQTESFESLNNIITYQKDSQKLIEAIKKYFSLINNEANLEKLNKSGILTFLFRLLSYCDDKNLHKFVFDQFSKFLDNDSIFAIELLVIKKYSSPFPLPFSECKNWGLKQWLLYKEFYVAHKDIPLNSGELKIIQDMIFNDTIDPVIQIVLVKLAAHKISEPILMTKILTSIGKSMIENPKEVSCTTSSFVYFFRYKLKLHPIEMGKFFSKAINSCREEILAGFCTVYGYYQEPNRSIMKSKYKDSNTTSTSYFFSDLNDYICPIPFDRKQPFINYSTNISKKVIPFIDFDVMTLLCYQSLFQLLSWCFSNTFLPSSTQILKTLTTFLYNPSFSSFITDEVTSIIPQISLLMFPKTESFKFNLSGDDEEEIPNFSEIIMKDSLNQRTFISSSLSSQGVSDIHITGNFDQIFMVTDSENFFGFTNPIPIDVASFTIDNINQLISFMENKISLLPGKTYRIVIKAKKNVKISVDCDPNIFEISYDHYASRKPFGGQFTPIHKPFILSVIDKEYLIKAKLFTKAPFCYTKPDDAFPNLETEPYSIVLKDDVKIIGPLFYLVNDSMNDYIFRSCIREFSYQLILQNSIILPQAKIAFVLKLFVYLLIEFEKFDKNLFDKSRFPFDANIPVWDSCSEIEYVRLFTNIIELPKFESDLYEYVENLATHYLSHFPHQSQHVPNVSGFFISQYPSSQKETLNKPKYIEIKNNSIGKSQVRLPAYIPADTYQISSKNAYISIKISETDNSWVYNTPFELLIILKHLMHLLLSSSNRINIKKLLITFFINQSPILGYFAPDFIHTLAKIFPFDSYITTEYYAALLCFKDECHDSSLLGFDIIDKFVAQENRLIHCEYMRLLLPFLPEFTEGGKSPSEAKNVFCNVDTLEFHPDFYLPVRAAHTATLFSICEPRDSLVGFPFWDILPFWLKIKNISGTHIQCYDLRQNFLPDMIKFISWQPINTKQLLRYIKKDNLHSDDDAILNIIPKNHPLIAEYNKTVVLLRFIFLFQINYFVDYNEDIIKEYEPLIFEYISLTLMEKYVLDSIETCHNQSNIERLLINRRKAQQNILENIKSTNSSIIAQVSKCFDEMETKSLQNKPVPWKVTFTDEMAIDAGGPGVELYAEIANSIFQSTSGLTIKTPNGISEHGKFVDAYLPYPSCQKVMGQYKAIGIYLGIVARNGVSQDLPFAPLVWKYIAYENIEESDILELDDNLALLFDSINKCARVEFAPDWQGQMIPINPNQSPVAICKSIIEMRIGFLKPSLKLIRKGFVKNTGSKRIRFLTGYLLSQLCQGENVIDVGSMKKITYYSDCQYEDQSIQIFWEVVERLSNEDRSLLLKFITARTRLPNAMTSPNFKINIQRKYYSHPNKELIRSSTCFNRLYLPDYTSLEDAYQKILISIQWTSTMENS